MEDSKLRQPQRDETRFTRQVELTMPDDVLVLILDDDIVTGHHSRYGSVLMLALWVSLSRSRSGKVCAEFKKKKEKTTGKKKDQYVTCCLEIYLLEEEAINVFLSSHDIQRRVLLPRSQRREDPRGIHAPIRLAILIRVGPAILSAILYPIIAQRCLSRDTWCNRIWKRENCVLFHGTERRIVPLLNLGKQSVSL